MRFCVVFKREWKSGLTLFVLCSVELVGTWFGGGRTSVTGNEDCKLRIHLWVKHWCQQRMDNFRFGSVNVCGWNMTCSVY